MFRDWRCWLYRRSILWAAFAAVIATLIWASTYSATYEVCGQEREAAQSEQGHLGPDVFIFFVCEGVVVSVNGELLTAIATVVMAAFTGTLWFVTGKAVDLARQEFHSTHRPRIRVRLFTVSTLNPGPHGVVIHFEVANVGDSPAHLIGQNVIVTHSPGFLLPWGHLRAFQSTERAADTSLASGTSAELWAEGEAMTEEQIAEARDRRRTLTAYGYILYEDDAGVRRRTGFLRTYEPDVGRFRTHPDPNYEYED